MPVEPTVPNDHVMRYYDLCCELARAQGGEPPDLDWIEWGLNTDMTINPGDVDEYRLVVTDCSDGDGYYWGVMGWYERDEEGAPWKLAVAMDFGGDNDSITTFYRDGKLLMDAHSGTKQ